MIINLPKNLEKETTHRYSANSFKLHRLPVPRPGQVTMNAVVLVQGASVGFCFAVFLWAVKTYSTALLRLCISAHLHQLQLQHALCYLLCRAQLHSSCAARGKCSGVLHIESSAVHSQTGLFVGTWTCGDQWNWQVHSFEGPVWQIEAQPWQI